jgi:hypothetical protein
LDRLAIGHCTCRLSELESHSRDVEVTGTFEYLCDFRQNSTAHRKGREEKLKTTSKALTTKDTKVHEGKLGRCLALDGRGRPSSIEHYLDFIT